MKEKKNMETVQLGCLIAFILGLMAPSASAYDFGAGDGIFIVLVVIVGILALFAFLGFIARKRGSV